MTRSSGFVAIALLAATVVSVKGARPAAAVSWSNPHHAYIIFVDPDSKSYSVKELSVDKRPSPPRTLGGPLTGFCKLSALAIGPDGSLYVTGTFGATCHAGVAIFAPGAFGNVSPVAMITGNRTHLAHPSGLAFDAAGNLYESQRDGGPSTTGSINIYARGATGNAAPAARILGSNTLFGGLLLYVAVDSAGEVFAGQAEGTTSQVLKFAAGANGNVAPVAAATLGSGPNFRELQVAGDIVYAAIGIARVLHPTVYELSTSNLAQVGGLMDPRFTFLLADADTAGRVYVQDLIRTRGFFNRGRLFEFEPGSSKPSRVRFDGKSAGGGYIVVGP